MVDDGRVGPLYEHTFPPSLAPSLSFVGIPKKVSFFLLSENKESSYPAEISRHIDAFFSD